MVSEKKTAVAVVMGSDSDMAVMQSCTETLSATLV
jgi:phosphoribosylcarboxyaminoimidazole (NCAIR) mutase